MATTPGTAPASQLTCCLAVLPWQPHEELASIQKSCHTAEYACICAGKTKTTARTVQQVCSGCVLAAGALTLTLNACCGSPFSRGGDSTSRRQPLPHAGDSADDDYDEGDEDDPDFGAKRKSQSSARKTSHSKQQAGRAPRSAKVWPCKFNPQTH